MELRICTEPQEGATCAQLVAVAQSARQHGFAAFFRADHVLPMNGQPAPPGPVEAMVSLAAIESTLASDDPPLTPDLGGRAGTADLARAILARIG